MPGKWSQLATQAPASIDTMLLLTDGTVLCHNGSTPHWWRLVPDASGGYVRGSWLPVADLRPFAGGVYAPLYYASAVLRSGMVFLAGGEYNNNSEDDLDVVQIFDPARDAWTLLPTPAGWEKIGDAPCCVLVNGRVLLGSIADSRTACFDPDQRTWSPAGAKLNASSSEETWTLLPDGSVLTADCNGHPNTERYLPASDTWVSAGVTPVDLVENSSIEIGPALLLPDGRVFAVGATGNTALYEPTPGGVGTWVAGPPFPRVANPTTGVPETIVAKDAPAALLPNGRVLCIGGHVDGSAGDYGDRAYCFEFDPETSTMARVDDPPNNIVRPYSWRMLLLPTGEVLVSNSSLSIAVYTPDGAPKDAWRPRITKAPSAVLTGQTYPIAGEQLNGLSQAVSYGDDASMATNYPIARLERGTQQWYCRTANHSTMAVQTGSTRQTTEVTIPMNIPEGPADLVIIANGISSLPQSVTVETPRHRAASH